MSSPRVGVVRDSMLTNPRIVKVKKTPESWWTPVQRCVPPPGTVGGPEQSRDHPREYKQSITTTTAVAMMMMVRKTTCLCRHLWVDPGPRAFQVLVQMSRLESATAPGTGAWQRVGPAHRMNKHDPVTSGSVTSPLASIGRQGKGRSLALRGGA